MIILYMYMDLYISSLNTIIDNEKISRNIVELLFDNCTDKKQKNKIFRNILHWATYNPSIFATIEPNDCICWDEQLWNMGTPREMIWKNARLKKFPVIQEKMEFEGPSLLKCRKCGKRKVEHYTKQTRSADEPETIFARCTLCNYRWRQ